jgi:hypothetical protein
MAGPFQRNVPVIFCVGRIAILLGMLVSVASISMLLSEPVTSERESWRHIERESQHKPPITDIELQVPITLQNFRQEGDLTSWHTAEELRLPDSLRTFLQQSEPLASVPQPLSP